MDRKANWVNKKANDYLLAFIFSDKEGDVMYKFKTTKELMDFLDARNESNGLRQHAIWAIKGTEEVNEYYDDSYVLFATNSEEQDEIEREFGISRLIPEIEEIISEEGYDDWRKTIFIFNDSGSGLVYFERISNDRKK